jgi:hypothetical protein
MRNKFYNNIDNNKQTFSIVIKSLYYNFMEIELSNILFIFSAISILVLSTEPASSQSIREQVEQADPVNNCYIIINSIWKHPAVTGSRNEGRLSRFRIAEVAARDVSGLE